MSTPVWPETALGTGVGRAGLPAARGARASAAGERGGWSA